MFGGCNGDYVVGNESWEWKNLADLQENGGDHEEEEVSGDSNDDEGSDGSGDDDSSDDEDEDDGDLSGDEDDDDGDSEDGDSSDNEDDHINIYVHFEDDNVPLLCAERRSRLRSYQSHDDLEVHLIDLLYQNEANPTFRYFRFQTVLPSAGDLLASFEKAPLTLDYNLFVEKVDRIIVFDNEPHDEEPIAMIPITVLMENEPVTRSINRQIDINNCPSFEDLEDRIKMKADQVIEGDPNLEFKRIRYEHREAMARIHSHGQEDIVLSLPTNWQQFKSFLGCVTIIMRQH